LKKAMQNDALLWKYFEELCLNVARKGMPFVE